MKHPRSYGEDLDALGDRGGCRDWGRRDLDFERPSSQRKFHARAENGRKGPSSSSSSYDRLPDDDRDVLRASRKRFDHDCEGFDRRKGFDRHRDAGLRSVPTTLYVSERIQRPEGLSSSRRDLPKGFRSERDRAKREDSNSSWRKLSCGKDLNDELRYGSNRGRRSANEEGGTRRSPSCIKDAAKSPPWSKESNCERSKKKNEEACKSNEIEEGEVEPELVPETESEMKYSTQTDPIRAEKSEALNGSETENWSRLEEDSGRETDPPDEDSDRVAAELHPCVGEHEHEAARSAEDVDAEIDTAPRIEEHSEVKEDVVTANACNFDNENLKKEQVSSPCPVTEEVKLKTEIEKPIALETEENKYFNPETQAEEIHLHLANQADVEEKLPSGVAASFFSIELSRKKNESKDKDLTFSLSAEVKRMDSSACMADDQAAGKVDPGGRVNKRGFELFSPPVAHKPEDASTSGNGKNIDGNLRREPLDLSLALPNVSLSLPTQDYSMEAPNCPGPKKTFPSLAAASLNDNSDRFTASMSFSGSHTFIHNPSCSFRQNSFDNCENSVGSHPIFHGADHVSQGILQGQSSNDIKLKEVSVYPRIFQNGVTSPRTSQASQGWKNGYYGGNETPNVDWKQHFRRQLSERLHQEIKSPTRSTGSHDTRSQYGPEKKPVVREKNDNCILFGGIYRDMGQNTSGLGCTESFIAQIISEPIHIMAKSIQKMPEQYQMSLKESVGEMLDNEHELQSLQDGLKTRSDLTQETLTHCHQVQLEILVAISTGLRDFLFPTNTVPMTDLVDIFLKLKCKNLACRSLLPVDECDCRVCSQRNGFCSACMCVLCSKFDMASNTCSWVGCDVCVHWCHTDCALHGSYIRSGRSVTGSHRVTEMQFFCVACNHPSEMFGFVKEVFRTCAKDWKLESLQKELEYVRRIFSSSEDTRGKQLHDMADQILQKWENNSKLYEIYSIISTFLTESDSKVSSPAPISVKEPQQANTSADGNGMVGLSQELPWLQSINAETKKISTRASDGVHPVLDWERMEAGHTEATSDSKSDVEKKPFADELESIVRIKQAEAQMFQTRADGARREADGLKRIAVAKNEKIEADYRSQISKLQLAEAEERRRQKLEELQDAERAHLEYFNMKVRMEADIKDLLLKMEATKRNLGI